MLTVLRIAHHNAMLTLEFVSLLLSKETPVQASVTLSPALREMVGIGTLGATNLSSSNLSRERVQENKLVATGRKLLDINKTADSILSAASRLQKEISLETKYWAEVRAVSDSGWSVSRVPHEPHTMGVKFGFSECESTPHPRNASGDSAWTDKRCSWRRLQGRQPRADEEIRRRLR